MNLQALLIALLALGPATEGPLDEQKLLSPDPVELQGYGYAVAINDSWGLVGSQLHDRGPAASVHAYDAATGNYVRSLTGSGSQFGDLFGSAIALSGSTAIVYSYEEEPIEESVVYLFDVSTGDELHRLTPANPAQYRYAPAVDIDGPSAIVVGQGRLPAMRGRAIVIDVAAGSEVRELNPLGDTTNGLNWSVALSGGVAIVGSPLENSHGTNSGAAYLFDIATGTQLAKLTASDASEGSYFGWSVDIEGNHAIVGSPGFNSGVGAVYVFDVATGMEIDRLTASDTVNFDMFGDSVALSGWDAIVGAPFAGDSFEGVAYLFDLRTGTERMKLTASDGEPEDFFGESVALFGNKALVGAYFNDEAGFDAGAAYLFTLSIPEPSSVVLAGIATLLLFSCRMFSSRPRS